MFFFFWGGGSIAILSFDLFIHIAATCSFHYRNRWRQKLGHI